MDERLVDGSLKRFRRHGVSAETTGASRQRARGSSHDKRISRAGSPKTKEQVIMLLEATSKCVLFDGLTPDQRNVVIDAMEEVHAHKDEAIIVEGENPTDRGAALDNFYVVDIGYFDVIKKAKRVHRARAGESFGEVALMHNTPRQATVKCASEVGMLWALSRSIFQEIQHLQALENAKALTESLKGVDLLASLEPSQHSRLTDSMEVVSFPMGERIIKQGDVGDKFYIILSGLVECSVDGAAAPMAELGRLEYFGERALLNDDVRTANVDAISPVTLATVTREVFAEVLGPLETLMETELTRRILKSVPILSHITEGERDQIVPKFRSREFKKGEMLIKQGDNADCLYIIKEGAADCFANGQLTKSLGAADFFGERALIKSEPRPFDVMARTALSAVSLSREDFEEIVGSALGPVLDFNMIKDAMRSAPILKAMSAAEREMVLDYFEFADFAEGDLIFRQGDPGYSFVLIREGDVKIVKDGEEIRTLSSGDFVGERALLFNEPRSCDVVVTSEFCYTAFLVKEQFEKCFGSIDEIVKRSSDKLEFDDLRPFSILGTGTFGVVKLVRHEKSSQTYAMKIVSKARVVAYNQQEHLMNEKRIMSEIDHPFCVAMAASFKDATRLYMVLEFCPGGELFTLLRKERRLEEHAAAFYSCQVMLAFDYLHNRNIIYRDLKPENLMIDARGYIRVVDFGFAKVIKDRTWTLCGTPEYLAPETIRNKGHGKGVDWWALGVLIYEIMAGYPPFCGDSAMATYKQILEGNLDFPPAMGLHARDIVRRLLDASWAKRLGCLRNGAQDVKAHRYFAMINQRELLRMKMKPPYVPVIKDNLDTSNFDPYEEQPEEPYEDDGSGWDNDF